MVSKKAGEEILKGFGIPEEDFGLIASIEEFGQELRRDLRKADIEQRRRHAMGRKGPKLRAELLSQLPPEENPKKKSKTLKQKAKKAGKKAKRAAKTDVGRAGIGAGVGAVALGPIGAVAGAGIAMATKKKKRKNNPSKSVKLSTVMGNMLLDYHKASPEVEHVAASALRGERVEIGYVKKARNDLKKLVKIQPKESEREQIGEVVDALDRVIRRAEANGNPVRARSLGAEIRHGRQGRAKKAAGRASRASSAAASAANAGLKKRLAKINPSTYQSSVRKLSDKKLDEEHKAVGGLITKARKYPETSRMVSSLVKARGYIVEEKRRRRSQKPNPKSGSSFTPSREELRLFRKYKMMGKLDDVTPEQLERLVIRLSNREKAELKAAEPTVMNLARKYVAAHQRHQLAVTTPGSTPAEVARAKKKLDDAENELTLFAEIRNLKPSDLALFVKHSKKKERQAKSRAHSARSNPLRRVTERMTDKTFRAAVSENIGIEIKNGKPRKQAVAIALSVARDQAPKKTRKLYGPDPKKNPKPKKKATKKKASNNKASKRRAPTAKQLNDKCFRLWEAYCNKPAKKRLQAVLDHLEKMKTSKAKSVKEERAACLRIANKEARRLGMK